MQATATRGPREEASITLAALWRTSQKLKALFRGSNITNKLLVSNPARPHFLAPTAINLPSLRRAPPLVFAPLSTAAALAVNPSSNSSPLRNAAAKGLAGAHVSLPYRLWAGSTQSCRILPTFPLQQAGQQSFRRLPSLPLPLSLPSFSCAPHTLQTSRSLAHAPSTVLSTPPSFRPKGKISQEPLLVPALRLAPRADVMSDNRSPLSAHSGFISREDGCR